jgi:diacylglycerol kinase family enzyme
MSVPIAEDPAQAQPGAAGAAEVGAPRERFTVVLNVTAGKGKEDEVADRVRAALGAAGISATVWTGHGTDVEHLARRAVADPACDVVIAAGGDGTVSAVAGVVAGTEKLFAVIPMGTLNHFAKDLGMPAGMEDAAAALVGARVRRVDVGEVNGITFVNNSSVGIYPRIVLERERLRGRFGHGKWLAAAWGLAAVLLRLRPLSLRIRWDGGVAVRRTTFAFIGNNRYDTALLETQRRRALDGGVLGVFVGTERTRLALFRLAVRAALRRIDSRDLEALEVREITLESHRGSLWVAVDGEVRRLRPPLRYRIRPGALRVLTPPRTP